MRTNKTLTIALATLFTSSLAFADSEVTGKITIEHAALVDHASSSVSPGMKDEISIRLYADGDVMDGVTYHGEIQSVGDETKVDGYSGEYTQNAGIRELYLDINTGGGWDARLGKQQVVWGTADGMKLLDIINPTDYAEMAQNQMEDSRLPVWALNLESGNTQVVISEPKENVFAGLNRGTSTTLRQNATDGSMVDLTQSSGTGAGTDEGNVFRMMGPETITGETNGFINITPDMGGIARRFAWGFGNKGALNHANMAGFTVGGFEAMTMAAMAGAMGGYNMVCATASVCNKTGVVTNANFNADADAATFNYLDLPDNFESAIAGVAGALGIADPNDVTGAQMLAYGFQPYYNTNLADVDGVDNSAFDYMPNANFLTFNAMVNAGSQYVYDMPDSDDVDFAVKTSQTTKNGVNYSLNFSNSYDKNPIIDLSWRDTGGNEIYAVKPGGVYGDTILLNSAADGSGTAFGGFADSAAVLRFTQKLARTKNLGTSFDTTVETPGLGPVVIRGEALYTQDSKQPVIDKTLLAIGDLKNALQMVDADRFKFVLGADITVLTNMMISGQYITDRNLDFVDTTSSAPSGTTGNRYTADYATMSLSNGFNKAIEDKQFYSLFFSKPFGPSGQHRWNNILMIEEGVGEDGKWNRFDVDYGISDNVQATVELNTYWGNKNTQFGQLKNSSNMQVGVKYSF